VLQATTFKPNVLLTVHHRIIIIETNVMNFLFSLLNINGLYVMKERPTKCIFKVNYIFIVSVLLLHVSVLQERHLQGAQMILKKLCVCYVFKCRISEGREWITVCVLSAEGTECFDHYLLILRRR
jgi:hypothetical protein